MCKMAHVISIDGVLEMAGVIGLVHLATQQYEENVSFEICVYGVSIIPFLAVAMDGGGGPILISKEGSRYSNPARNKSCMQLTG